MRLREKVTQATQVINTHLRKTPLEFSPNLSSQTNARVFLKLENFQVTGSFKARGAINKLSNLTPEQKHNGIIAASSGNHGLGVAYGAQKLGTQSIIYVPTYADPSKVEGIEQQGANVVRFGDDCLLTEIEARKQAKQKNLMYISPYNDLDVIAGQGTIAAELVEDLDDLDAVFVALGGGGLISGIGSYLKDVSPKTQVIACSPSNSPAMHQCLQANKIIDVPCYDTLSDATAGGVEEGSITFDLCSTVIDQSILVSEEEIRNAMLMIFQHHHMLVEGAAGVAVASFLKMQHHFQEKRVAILLCGANIGLDKLRKVLQ